jgi:two-component system cell cycle sensor histidine kinase/response regulator CckA
MRPSTAISRYGVTVLAVFAALAVRLVVDPVLRLRAPYLPFLLAVMIAARVGGKAPGLAATALSAVVSSWFFLEPLHSLAVNDPHAGLGLVLFVMTGAVAAVMVGNLHAALVATARAESALRFQGRLVDLSHEAIITMDGERRITGWNLGAEELYGWTKAEATGRVVHDLLQTSGTTSPAEFDPMLRREGRWDGEVHHTARDGRRLIVESRQVMLRDQRDGAAGILEINRDITERSRAEREVRESRHRLALALKAGRSGVFHWDAKLDRNVWSDELMDLYGFQPGEFGGSAEAWVECLVPEDREAGRAAIGRSLETGLFEHEFRIRRRDTGEIRWMYGRADVVFDEAGEPVQMVGINMDITDRKQTEDALKESEERYRALFEAMQEGFAVGEVICDGEGKPADWRYAQVNEAMVRMLGRPREEIVGHTYRGLYPHAASEFWVEAFGQVALTGQPARLEHYGDGTGRHYRAIVYCPARGQFAAVLTDISESRKAEERLRHAQKMESVGLLAGGVAHDFNNLLTVIMGSASSALEECPTCEYSRAIVAAAERAARLTKQLLAYAGKDQVIKRAIDLTERVSQSKHLLAASVPKRVALVFDLAAGMPPVEDDPSRVDQILMNLVINAAEAIPPKTDGRIEIRTGMSEITQEAARQQGRYEVEAGSYAWLEVRDDGTGMDADTLGRIFDPFFSTKFAGRGLGLAAVDGIVRSNRGFIEVKSAPGDGTTFRVFLPAAKKKLRAEAPEPISRGLLQGVRTVLVVDDEDVVRRLASMVLRKHGYEVLEATDGKDALGVLSGCVSPPDAVLLDFAMPVMGGDELLPMLAELYPSLKVIISSGYAEDEACQHFGSAGVAGFLQKPYTAATLAKKMDEILGGSPRQNGPRAPVASNPQE